MLTTDLARAIETTRPLRLLVLPARWHREADFGPNSVYARNRDGLRVLAASSVEADGRRWAHVSMSYADHLPSYDDLCDVKRLFLGPQSKAIQVFAPEAEHVNVHSFCLHLYACLDGDPLPDFRRMGVI